MDNRDSNKKRPFGRDDRSGRSFFRTRREGAMRREEQNEQNERRNDERGGRESARPAFAKDKKNRTGAGGDERRFSSGRPFSDKKGAKAFRPDRSGERRERSSEERSGRSADRRPEFSTNLRGRKPRRDEAAGDKAAPALPAEVRLNRFIAMSGVCSRREADQLIEAGEVTVNGVRVDQLGTKVRPAQDEVRLGGELLKGERKVYIVLNKPKGYVTTMEDPHADRTVIDLLKGECKERVYPVGRLDKNTTGVLLLTNDGNLTKELTHPSFAKKKIYHVFLDKDCAEADLDRLVEGIELEDGPIHADEVSFVEGNRKEVGVELHSGRNRIVRRMFESLGYEVVKLDRVYFAGLTKMGLRRGFWRYLTPREVSALKSGAYE